MNSPRRFITLTSFVAIGTLLNLQGSIVSSSNDSGPGSLRSAIANAIGGETITFDPTLNGSTITLSGAHLLINNLAVTLDATSLPSGVALSGNNLNRVIAISGNSNVTLKKITIQNGRSSDHNAGAIFLAEGNLNMTDCILKSCFATYNGGAIYLAFGTTATIDRCSFVGNSTGTLGFGGAVFVSGASTTLFRSCVISGNSSPFGGGLAIFNSSPTLTNCTIQGNSGEGLRNDSNSDPVIQNSIIWENTGSGNTASQQLKNANGSNPIVSYSLIQGASENASFEDSNAVIWGTGNFNGELVANDPKFASALGAGSAPNSGGDLRLLAGSAVLNEGNNSAGIGSLDLSRSARIQNTTVDLGAYEGSFVSFALLHPSLSTIADDNQNGISNFQEYAMGFNPTEPSHNQANPEISTGGGFKSLTINQRYNAVDFTSRLVTTTDFDSWTEMVEGIHYSVESTTSVTSDRKVWILRLISSDPKRFYRQAFLPLN